MANDNDNDNADANALAALLLRHRLFPRAMAWNVQRQSTPRIAEQLVVAAEMQQTDRVDALDVALSFPIIKSSIGLNETRPVKSSSPMYFAAEGDERERLFRAVGKYLDASSTTTGLYTPALNTSQSIPMYYQAHPASNCHLYSSLPSPDRITTEQQSAFQAMKISSYAEKNYTSGSTYDHVLTNGVTTASTLSPSSPESHSIRLRSPSRPSTSGQKRTRGSIVLEAAATINSSVVVKDEIAPSLARALLTGCGAKQCSYNGCKKIAVSKGRCRGHGGGRRCQQTGCTKCAQSRSPFCWAHGGGKRCEALNCRRSRKTKRFCVDHVNMELTALSKPASDNSIQSELTQAAQPADLKSAAMRSKSFSEKTSGNSYASADSDDSVGRQSTLSCDSNSSFAQNKESKRMLTAEYAVREQTDAQHDQYAGEVSGIPPQALQLPSLNEALLRTVPTQYSFEAM